MKKIALARFKYTPYGGAENYLFRVCEAIRQRGVDYRILSTNWSDEAATKIGVPKFLPSFVRVLLFAWRVCAKKEKSELLFSLERLPCADVYRAGDGVHKAWIDTRLKSGDGALRIFSNPLQAVYLWLEKHTFKNAKKIIANSKFVKNDIIKYYRIDADKIEVVYNGVPKNGIDASMAREKLGSEFGISESEKIILFVGSGFMRKGALEFLELLSKLQNRSFKAIIVGKEKNIKRYEAISEKLGVNAIFTGPRRDADMFYAGSDIFLFPTRYEPFSNVCLEAMAGGCAVITTAQNGASEILDGEFVMGTPDDTGILPILERLLSEETYLKSVKESNKERSKEYSVEANVEKTLEILERL